IELDKRLRAGSFRSAMLLQIHDELILESPEAEIDEVEAVVVDCMERVCDLDVPLKVDVSRGQNLAAVKD
ncbi:MAG: DNA polymerase, partial [Acidimicrobiia bacterium]|nr:DNA polymerase [Acidimicrobiia bacterium]